jgi:hypothetical protein
MVDRRLELVVADADGKVMLVARAVEEDHSPWKAPKSGYRMEVCP